MKRGRAIRLAWEGRGGARNEGRTARGSGLEFLRRGSGGQLLIAGENLRVLQTLARRATPGPEGKAIPARFALAYLDPPFFTGREHRRVTRSRLPGTDGVVRALTPAFDDRWDGLHAYLDELGERITLTRSLLEQGGCLVVHVDPKTSHYVKILCDEIFGPECFASEIIWRYRRWPSKTRNFQRVHDVLLRYVRDAEATPRFHQLYEPLAPSTQKTWGTGKQRAVVDALGRRRRSSTTDAPSPGAPLGDVWEIGIVAPVARERTGYPTQKPEALLERLILSCTDPGDAVLDAYAGSGTTVAVAARLGRVGVAIDQNPEAIEIAAQRLLAQGVGPTIARLTETDRCAELRPVRVA